MTVTYSNKNHWYLFLIFPFLTAILAIKNYRASWAKNIIWAFIVFYGFTYSLPTEDFKAGPTSDINRYILQIRKLYIQELNFRDIVKLYQDNEDIDILQLTLAIGISRFTNNPQVLTTIYGFIFGFFFSRNIWFVIERMRGKFKFAALLLLIAYVLVDPFWNINGFRFYTAAQVFIYGLLPFLFDGRKKGIFISGLSFLVHFSFLLPLAILLLYVLAGNRAVIYYFIFFLLSIVTSEINITAINSLIEENAPAALANRTASYRNEEKVEEFRSDTEEGEVQVNWYIKLYTKALQWPLMVFLIMLFIKRKKIEQVNKRFLNSLAFTLLFFGVANLMASLPSGGRFLTIAELSALPIIILYVQNFLNEKYISKTVMLASPALLLFIIVSIRFGFLTVSVNTLLGNPLFVFFIDYNIPLDQLIK